MSSNSRGDEPRATPSASSRQRLNRPTADDHRVESGIGADTSVVRRVDAAPDKAPDNAPDNAPDHAPDNVVPIDATTATTPKQWSRRAKPQRPGSGPALPDADAATVGAANAPTANIITGPATLPPAAPPIAPPPAPPAGPPIDSPASPVTGPVVMMPAAHLGAPGPPPPILLAPAPMPHVAPPQVTPLPPSVFDDESNRTGPMSFDALFEPEAPPAGVARRQRAVQFTQTGRRNRPRLRRVTRVVRHVDPWSVFKVALCFSMVLYGVCLTAGVLLWNVAYTTGTIDNVQRFFESFGWDTFRFKGGELFHNAWIAGLFGALALTGLIVLAVTLFNLITDLVGGIRVSVLEEEVVERNPVVRGPLLRRRSRAVSTIMANGEAGDDTDSRDPAVHLG